MDKYFDIKYVFDCYVMGLLDIAKTDQIRNYWDFEMFEMYY